MEKSKPRKEVQNVTVDEYLALCQEDISEDEYLRLEEKRVDNYWVGIVKKQELKCYYCKTHLQVIQQLILNRIIKPRKRGRSGYSGLHFELDHKNADKKDNNIENLVASCYYCNNDKSDTFASDIFKNYFGLYKNQAFNKLFKDQKLKMTYKFRHNLKGKVMK